MDEDLITLLNDWRNSKKNYFKAIRNVRYKSSPIGKGEFMISIQSALQVNNQAISLGRLFFTFAQSDVPYIKSKKGDVYNLKKFLKKFDEDFNNEVQKRLSESMDRNDESDFKDL